MIQTPKSPLLRKKQRSLLTVSVLVLLAFLSLVAPTVWAQEDQPSSTPAEPSPTAEPTSTPQPTSTPSPLPTPTSPPPTVGLIRIMPDGSVEGTDKIQHDGNTYTLTDDITCSLKTSQGPLPPCMIIMRDNIVFDGAGHSLEGDHIGIGLYIRGTHGITVKNLGLKGFSCGISTFMAFPVPPDIVGKTTHSNKIINTTIEAVNAGETLFSEYGGYGINLGYAKNMFLEDNTIKAQDPTRGVYVSPDCGGTIIQNNKLIDCSFSILSLKSLSLIGNTINGKPVVFLNGECNRTVEAAEQVFLYRCSQVTVQNIHQNDHYACSVRVETSDNCTVTDCSGDILLMDSQNCLVQNNKPHSIILSSSNHNKICQNFISGSGQALQLTTSSYNDIYANSILNSKNSSEAKGLNYSGKNPTAIVFGYTDEGVSQYNSVHGNLLVNHGVGIQCSNVKDISIYANVIEGCNCAISLNTDNNNIYQNNLTDNLLAISICGSHNAIYHNNFLNNTNQVSIRDEYYFTSNLIVAYSTNNTFDQGPTGGNYWSTFNGVDSDGNGISETPYKIDNRTVDNHPFMNPLPVSLPTLPTQSQPQPEPYPTPTATNINPEQPATPLMTDSTWAIIVIVAAVLVAVLVANWTLKKRTTKFDA